MTLVVLDVVVVLTPELRRAAIVLGDELARRMSEHGRPAHFRLGQPFGSADGGACEPHVSIFMLAVAEDEIAEVVRATSQLSSTLPVLAAEGHEYRHNPFGAPELFFRKTAKWIGLQREVIAAVEPLRQGRLREVDPAGMRIRDLIDSPGADPDQRAQLLRFGYDEVTDETGRDRFNPHVTLAWPVDPAFRVDLAGLPPPQDFSGTLTELAVYGMSPFGTCTTLYGTAPLGTAVVGAAENQA